MTTKEPLYQLEVRLPNKDGQIQTQVIKLKGTEQIIFGNRAEFPETGDSQHLYYAIDENKLYVWRNGQYSVFSNNLEFSTHYDFPNIGNNTCLYIATDENKIYRWASDHYVVVGSDYNDIKLIDCGGAL